MRRIPVRIRLTLVFAGVMAGVLVATAIFLHVRLASQIDRAVDEGLQSRADDVAALVRRSGPLFADSEDDRLTDADESFAQVIDERGRVLGATPEVEDQTLLTAEQRQEAADDTEIVQRVALPELDDEPMRLLATPVEVDGRDLIVVVGSSLEHRDEALSDLRRQLLIGIPAALLLSSVAGYGLAAAALRPVEAMRRQAAAISGAEASRRLPVPPARDQLRRLGETLNAMLSRLEAALTRERIFVADASHELRTPLAILKAELELALEEGRSTDELRAAIRSAAEETDRVVRLAEDLLVISRADQGTLPVRAEPVSLAEIVVRVADRFRRRASVAGRTLEVDVPAALSVVADPLRLEQAVGNLIDNALRYGDGTVRVRALERDSRVEVHVVDEGEGFPSEFLDRAFDRFSRADEARARGGTGLGLAVVQGIASAHGGSVGASNRRAGGADVWLALPRDPGRRRAGTAARNASGAGR
jgi:heavy metal sensor kinase